MNKLYTVKMKKKDSHLCKRITIISFIVCFFHQQAKKKQLKQNTEQIKRNNPHYKSKPNFWVDQS
jgi:hypothetical protein